MSEIIKQIKPVFEEKVSPFIKILNKINVSPNFLTISGLIFIAIGSIFLIFQNYIVAGFFLLIGNLCDALDGTLARKYKKTSKFGAFLDSVVDRLADAFPLMAIAILLKDYPLELSLTILAMIFSFMVSYTRARAEGLGIECKVGILERPERSIILIIFTFLSIPIIAVILIAIGSFITTLQRIYCVYKKTKGE